MFVLNCDLVTTLVCLPGIFQSVISSFCRGVNILEWQAGAIEDPFSLSTGIGSVGDRHDERLSSVSHQVLISSLDFWHSC